MSRFLPPCLLGLLSFAVAASPPRTVTLPRMERQLEEALVEVKKQTGVAVVSELPGTPKVTLELSRATPWQALGAIASQVKADIVPPTDGKRLRLVPLPPRARPLPTSYDGPFRFRVLRVSTSRDLASGDGETVLSLEVSWLPRALPLFIEDQPQLVRALDATNKQLPFNARAAEPTPVEGKFVFPLEVKLPTVPRGKKLNLVEGKVGAVLPTEMLTFTDFRDLAALAQAKPGGAQRQALPQKGVTCRVEGVALGRDRWSIRMSLDYPEGNRVLESYQAGSMVVFNELLLVSGSGKGMRVLRPSASVANVTGSRRTVVTFHFTEGGRAPPSKPSAWKLRYTAPALIVDVPLRFSFKDVPLP